MYVCVRVRTFSRLLQTLKRSEASGWNTANTEFSLNPVFNSCVCAYVRACMRARACMSACVRVCVCVCLFVCVYVRMRVFLSCTGLTQIGVY